MRRAVRVFLLAVVCTAGLIALEVVMALRRDYLVKGPPEPIRADLGDPSLPPLRLVVLGDSTSVGVGTTPAQSFPVVLSERLSNEFHVRLSVFGESGARVRDVAEKQVGDAIAANPDIVLICIGANDSTHVTSKKAVARHIEGALDRLAASGSRIVVAGPPDMGTTRAFAQPLRWISGWRGRVVSGVIEEAARKRDVPFIPLAELTGSHFDRQPGKYYSRDLFHPGTAGYALWAEKMYPFVARAARQGKEIP